MTTCHIRQPSFSLFCIQHQHIGISLGQLSSICNHSYYNDIFRRLAQLIYQSSDFTVLGSSAVYTLQVRSNTNGNQCSLWLLCPSILHFLVSQCLTAWSQKTRRVNRMCSANNFRFIYSQKRFSQASFPNINLIFEDGAMYVQVILCIFFVR
jgi:hypothetical protein